MNNLHITLTDFRHESRVIKETHSIIGHNFADEILVAALYKDGLEINEVVDKKINLRRFPLFTRCLPKNMLIQLIKYLEFSLRVWWYYRKRNVGMVNIHTLALLPIGVLLKYCYGSLLIYDTHELETEKNGSTGIRKILNKWTERLFIRFVDQVFVVGKSIAENYSEDYGIDRPIVLFNCPNYYTPKVNNNYFRERFNISNQETIFLYQGGLSFCRGVGVILDAFKPKQERKAVVIFMGYGPLEDEIKDSATEYSNIFYHPAVSPNTVLEFTSSADIGISLIENTCLSYYYCMPNKLFEYVMAGLPVLVSNMYDMAQFVQQNKVGVVVEDETPASLNKAIALLLKMDLSTIKQNALLAAKEHSWETQEKKMVSAYSKLLDSNKC